MRIVERLLISGIIPSDSSGNVHILHLPRIHYILGHGLSSMHYIPKSRDGQYLDPLDDETVMRIAGDPVSVGILRELNWRTMTMGELEDKVPGCRDDVDVLRALGILTSDGGLLRISEPYQAFGSELDYDDGICTALGSPKCGWFHDLGYLSSYVVCSLVSLMFDIEPVWEGESGRLAFRSGLIDPEGSLTDRGREVAFSLFSMVSDVFDTRGVGPEVLIDRWSGNH